MRTRGPAGRGSAFMEADGHSTHGSEGGRRRGSHRARQGAVITNRPTALEPAIEKGKEAMRRARRPLVLSLLVASLVLAAFVLPAGQAQAAKQPPNILFIIMDDVGIDPFQTTFAFGAET